MGPAGATGSTDDPGGEADSSVKFDAGPDSGSGGNPDGTPCEENVDIVFVMDVSTSMDAFLDKLADEILVVDQALQQLDLPGEPHYGLVVFVDDYALLFEGAPYPSVQALRDDFLQWSASTSSNQQVGGGNFNTTWTENGLGALYAAATGFQWRPEATDGAVFSLGQVLTGAISLLLHLLDASDPASTIATIREQFEPHMRALFPARRSS